MNIVISGRGRRDYSTSCSVERAVMDRGGGEGEVIMTEGEGIEQTLRGPCPGGYGEPLRSNRIGSTDGKGIKRKEINKDKARRKLI